MLLNLVNLVPAAAMALCSAAAPTPTVSPAAAMPMPAIQLKELSCLAAFSKDFCDGFMYPGNGNSVGCPPGTQECKTLDVTGATLYLPMKRNLTLCSATGKCDEIPEKDGYLKVSVDYSIRINEPCPYRGCISGQGEYRADDGNVYEGVFMGTIGAGTHRDFACPEARTCLCEKCLDVEYLPDYRAWRIGFEATFHGKNNNGDGETLCISLSGDFYVEGNSFGPFDLTGNFKIKGTADGVLRTFCH